MAYRKPTSFNVLDYGADNGGNTGTATATTAAINACITYGLAHSPGGWTSIYFPAGNYVINGTISCNASFVTLRGDGTGATNISTTVNGTMISLGNGTTPVQRQVEICDMSLWYQLDADVARSNSIGILFSHCSRSSIHDITIHGLGVGISLLGDNSWSRFNDLTFEGSAWSTLTNSSRAGIFCSSTGPGPNTGCIVKNIVGLSLYDATVKVVPGAGDWLFDSIEGYGTVANSTAVWFDRSTAAYSDYVAVSNVKMDGEGRAAVYLVNQNRGSITNVAGGGAITNTVLLSGCTDITLAGIGPSGTVNRAIALTNGTTLANSIIDGETQITLTNGDTNHDLVVASSFVEITGPTAAFNVGGIAGGWGGRLVTFWSNAAFTMTVDLADASSSVSNRIVTTTGGNVVCGGTAPAWATIQYTAALSRWILLGHS